MGNYMDLYKTMLNTKMGDVLVAIALYERSISKEEAKRVDTHDLTQRIVVFNAIDSFLSYEAMGLVEDYID